MRLCLAALLILLVAAVPPARAGGTLLERGAVGGPFLSGDRLVWFESTPGGYDVQRAAPDGSGLTTHRVEAPLEHASFAQTGFDASERRAALSALVVQYESRKGAICCVTRSTVSSGPVGQPLESFATPCGSIDPHRGAVAVDGDLVATLVNCGSDVLVRDFAAAEGAQRDFQLPDAGWPLRIAGPYVATLRLGELVVREWRTGVERLRVPGGSGWFDLRADGTVALLTAESAPRRVMIASPAAPEPRLIADDGGAEVRIAGDRVAYGHAGGGAVVRGLDGSLVALSNTAGVTDFDGNRLAWVDRSCAREAIATWDLQGAAPALPRANPCPIATLRSRTLRATPGPFGSGSVRVKLACAAEPAAGCGGEVKLYAEDPRRKNRGRLVDMTRGTYRLAPGGTTTVEMGYLKRRVCIALENGLRPIVEITGPGSSDGGLQRVKRRRARVVGLDVAIASCSA